ncbi:hypothetical protein [Actinomadura verrucosospora]|uniref:Uncharacterized protein n=1 Tax=Actinomadura verrucosospora TaxID=46165 RepID=A0A7D4A2M5_ACTVE|nr:hypothetical protein [Actinomadura verrucosospora]QKG27026.1 hypothetical protein ACTIVE_8679 [Actinomadura verrucosospora]
MLDRLDGPNPPRLVCIDPRRTKVAERATVHLPIRNGTDLALMRRAGRRHRPRRGDLRHGRAAGVDGRAASGR